jgi:hypothetical protein
LRNLCSTTWCKENLSRVHIVAFYAHTTLALSWCGGKLVIQPKNLRSTPRGFNILQNLRNTTWCKENESREHKVAFYAHTTLALSWCGGKQVVQQKNCAALREGLTFYKIRAALNGGKRMRAECSLLLSTHTPHWLFRGVEAGSRREMLCIKTCILDRRETDAGLLGF